MRMKADLFIGGLPEYIKVNVELKKPQDLQTAMHLARPYERWAAAMMPPPPRANSTGRSACPATTGVVPDGTCGPPGAAHATSVDARGAYPYSMPVPLPHARRDDGATPIGPLLLLQLR